MLMSCEIQRRKKSNRSKSPRSVWVIFLNEDITVYHFVKKHSHDYIANKGQLQNLPFLFTFLAN